VIYDDDSVDKKGYVHACITLDKFWKQYTHDKYREYKSGKNGVRLPARENRDVPGTVKKYISENESIQNALFEYHNVQPREGYGYLITLEDLIQFMCDTKSVEEYVFDPEEFKIIFSPYTISVIPLEHELITRLAPLVDGSITTDDDKYWGNFHEQYAERLKHIIEARAAKIAPTVVVVGYEDAIQMIEDNHKDAQEQGKRNIEQDMLSKRPGLQREMVTNMKKDPKIRKEAIKRCIEQLKEENNKEKKRQKVDDSLFKVPEPPHEQEKKDLPQKKQKCRVPMPKKNN